jgi:hypothetical protein
MSLSSAQMMDRNLALAEQHLLSVLENPQMLEGIPQNAHVIFLPEDDPALLEANLRLANQLARGMGHNGSRKPIILMLLPIQEDHDAIGHVLYDSRESTYVRVRDSDPEAPYGEGEG